MPDDKVTLETEKLRQDIRSLRLQRLLAILGVVGTIIAFLVGNMSDIKAIFYPPPKIKLVFQGDFLKRTGTFSLYHNTDINKALMKLAAKEATDWVSVDPGAYDIIISSGKSQVFKRELILKNGDREAVIIPPYFTPNIKLVVTSDILRPAPGSTLKFHIQTSGNGYLWVYEISREQGFRLLYPGVGAASNRISVNKPFILPDSNNYGISAGDQPGEEKLLFVVTSSSHPAQANKIAARMSGVVTKASGSVITENWGVQLLSYQVQL